MAEKSIPALEDFREKFDQLDVEMEDSLEDFIQQVELLNIPETLPLDYSRDSIERIEKLLLYVNEKTIILSDEGIFITKIARYFGEVVRKHMGGHWALCENANNINYGLPWLTGFKSLSKFGWSPIPVVLNFKMEPRVGLLAKSTKDIFQVAGGQS